MSKSLSLIISSVLKQLKWSEEELEDAWPGKACLGRL